MPIVFNPFDPLAWWAAMMPRAVYPTQPKLPDSTPINIKTTASDPGLTWHRSKNELTLSGVAAGPLAADHDPMGTYWYDRSISFSLDSDRAPTIDIHGRRNYTEKNSRLFTYSTSAGKTALECAQALAKKVNAGDDFRATVQANIDGSATLSFRRR